MLVYVIHIDSIYLCMTHTKKNYGIAHIHTQVSSACTTCLPYMTHISYVSMECVPQ